MEVRRQHLGNTAHPSMQDQDLARGKQPTPHPDMLPQRRDSDMEAGLTVQAHFKGWLWKVGSNIPSVNLHTRGPGTWWERLAGPSWEGRNQPCTLPRDLEALETVSKEAEDVHASTRPRKAQELSGWKSGTH